MRPFAIVLLLSGVAAASPCKPDEACWPRAEEWQAFGKTLKGKLVQPKLPGKLDNPFAVAPRAADDLVSADDPGRQRRLAWAVLMKRAYALDVLVCPRCQGPMRLVSVIQDERVAARILEHLGLPARAPPRGGPWRSGQQLALDDLDRYDGVDATYPS